MTLSTLHDPELGSIVLRPDTRARRLTFRMRDGRLHVSLPPGTPVAEVRKAVDQLRPRLKTMRGAGSLPLIDTDYRIDTRLQIICPAGTDFRNAELQAWLRKVIVEALRHRAKAILPPRLGELARRHGLAFRSVKINTGHTRWGSCSAGKDINLSCYLLLLPARLADYVLLHELAHTREMNHGPGFWALLDRLTDGQAQALRRELKLHHTDLPPATTA